MILTRTTGPEDWKRYLAQPDLHWKPQRSAMETALAWEEAVGAPQEVQALLPADARLIQAIVEYPVNLPGGSRSSFNDVFALFSTSDGLIACMVEAKREESFGPTLGEWLKGASPAKHERLAFLCSKLGVSPNRLDPALRYQLFHRAASAVIAAEVYHAGQAVMMVQSFSPDHSWFADFAAFARLMGAAPEIGTCSSCATATPVPLALGWVHSPFRSGGAANGHTPRH